MPKKNLQQKKLTLKKYLRSRLSDFKLGIKHIGRILQSFKHIYDLWTSLKTDGCWGRDTYKKKSTLDFKKLIEIYSKTIYKTIYNAMQ